MVTIGIGHGHAGHAKSVSNGVARMLVQAEVSLYPLKTPDLAPSIYRFVKSLENSGVEIEIGRMSTVLTGESGQIFAALRLAYEQAAADGRHALVVKIMNPGMREGATA